MYAMYCRPSPSPSSTAAGEPFGAGVSHRQGSPSQREGSSRDALGAVGRTGGPCQDGLREGIPRWPEAPCQDGLRVDSLHSYHDGLLCHTWPAVRKEQDERGSSRVR